jgi:hypothetical protein
MSIKAKPEILQYTLNYLSEKFAIGKKTVRIKSIMNNTTYSSWDLQIALDDLLGLDFISSAKANAATYYRINERGLTFLASSSFMQLLEERQNNSKKVKEQEKRETELQKLQIAEIKTKLSDEYKAFEKKNKTAQLDFFGSTTKKNKLSQYTMSLTAICALVALMISVIHLALAFFP